MIPYDKRSGKIWYNNELVDWADAKIHILNHGLHYASCVFEGERVYDGSIFKLEEHTSRLFYSAKRMGITMPYSETEINDACNKIISVQNIKDGYVRPMAWRGSEMMAISAQQTKIHVAVATWDWGSYFDPKLKVNGIMLNISNWRKPPPNSIPWDTKASGLYMINTLSKHDAEQQGYTDSLMLDHEGNVAEATGANIFFKTKDGEIHTPIPDSFLDGITRRTVIEIAKLKTFLQMVSIALLLTGETGNKILNFQDYNAQTIGIILLWLSAFLTLFTGYEYLRKGIDHAMSEDSKK